MNVEQIITLGIGIFGAVFGNGFIQFWLNRKDKQKQESIESKLQPIGEKIDKILNEQKKTEKDNLRTQLLVMMNMMPNNQEEIMTCAERYFKQLEGDWFYSSLFAKYLKENNIEPPIWFNVK